MNTDKIYIHTIDNPIERKRATKAVVCAGPVKISELVTYDPDYSIVYNGKILTEEELTTTTIKPGEAIARVIQLKGDESAQKLGTVLIAAAALATGNIIAAGAAWGAASFVAAGAIYYLGGWILQKFAPVTKDVTKESENYSWDTPRPVFSQGSPVGLTFGTVRIKSPQVLGSCATADGMTQYLQTLLSGGEGPVDSITDIKINENPIENYSDVTTEIRLGTNDQEAIKIEGLMDSWSDIVLDYVISDAWTTHQTNINTARQLELSIFAPLGISARKNSVRYSGHPGEGTIFAVKFNVTIQYKKVADVTWSETTAEICGETGAPFRKRIRIENLSPGQYDVRIKKETAYVEYWWINSNSGIVVDWFAETTAVITDNTDRQTDCKWDVLSAMGAKASVHPGKSIVALKIRATNQLSGGYPTISWTQTRSKVWVWNPTAAEYQEEAADNPAWAAYDLIHYCRKWKNINTGLFEYTVYGAPADTIIYSEFKAWADYCALKSLKFNYYCATSESLVDALKPFHNVGRGTVIIKGAKFGATCDMPKDPVQLFNVGNIKKGTFKETFLPTADRANNIEITYTDKNKQYEQITLPVYANDWDDSTNVEVPTQIRLDGITDQDQAYAQGKYYLLCNKLLQRTVAFEVSVDALAADIGDVILIQHDLPQWGYGGRILQVLANNQVKLDRAVIFDPAETYQLLLRHAATDVIETFTATGTGETDIITVDPVFYDTIVPYDDIYAFGKSNITSKPFTITNISRTEDLTRAITAIEYNAGVYEEDWTPPVISYSELRVITDVINLTVADTGKVSSDGTTLLGIQAAWDLPRSQGETITKFHVTVNSSIGIKSTTITENFNFETDGLNPGKYTITVRAENKWGQLSAGVTSAEVWVPGTLYKPYDPAAVTVELQPDGTWNIIVTPTYDKPSNFAGWLIKACDYHVPLFDSDWTAGRVIGKTTKDSNILNVKYLIPELQYIFAKGTDNNGQESEGFASTFLLARVRSVPDIYIASYRDQTDYDNLVSMYVINGTAQPNGYYYSDPDLVNGGYKAMTFLITYSALVQKTTMNPPYETAIGNAEIIINSNIPHTGLVYQDNSGGSQTPYTGAFFYKNVDGESEIFMAFTIPAQADDTLCPIVMDASLRIQRTSITSLVAQATISNTGTRVAPNRIFNKITGVQVSIIQVTGETASITRFADINDTTGAIIYCYDAAGNAVAGTVAITYTGY